MPPNPTQQLQKLNELLAALATNPFYQTKLQGLAEVGTLEEFTQKVPFTTKAEIAQDQISHPPYGTNLTDPLTSYSRFHQTSGTSGQPLIWLDNPAGWQWLLSNWQWVWQKAKIVSK